MDDLQNVNISSTHLLPNPEELLQAVPINREMAAFVKQSRKTINDILFGKDKRMLLVMGPCSIHNTEAGLEYARKLKELSKEVEDRFFVVMRAYFEKPRTSLGWKGLIHDPKLDGTNELGLGLEMARKFLLELAELEMPAATELIDPITPQYLSDLIAWSAIGARTTESQLHRQLASGLPMPIGFKNSTEGAITPAVYAIKAASQAQTLLHITKDGRAAYSQTKGNQDCHLVLRGGKDSPNYSIDDINKATQLLEETGLRPVIMVDCSHGNSMKNAAKQIDVFKEVLGGLKHTPQVRALMLESNLRAGNQPFPQPLEAIDAEISITDPCLSFHQTEILLKNACLQNDVTVTKTTAAYH